MFQGIIRRARLGAAVGLLLCAQLVQIASPLIPTASAADTFPIPLPGTDPISSVQVCHATTSDANPYNSVTVSVSSADPTAGHGDHIGPVWDPTLKKQHIEWGDIIPPFYYTYNGQVLYFAGMNWDKDAQIFWQYGCDITKIPVAPSTVAVSTEPCVLFSGGVDSVTVHIENTNDVYDDTITYTVTIAGQTQSHAIADDSSYDFVFAGLTPGTYTVSVVMAGDAHSEGITYTTSMQATVGSCPVAQQATTPPAPTKDPCGLNNIVWNIAASGETTEYTWVINAANQLVYTAKQGYYFMVNGQQVSTISYDLPADSGELCGATLPTPPAPVDPCGQGNAYWGTPLPAGTSEYTWELRTMADGVHLYAVTTANYTFPNNEREYDFGLAKDSGAMCPIPVPTQPTCTTPGSVTVADPGDGFSYYFTVTVGMQTTTYAAGDVAGGILQGSTVVVNLYRAGVAGGTLITTTVYEVPLLSCITIPPTPEVNDPCGIDNASWVTPGDTTEITWEIVNDELIATAHGSLFTDGKATHNYGIARDGNVLCTPLSPTINPICGLAPNDTIEIPTITDPSTAHFHYGDISTIFNDDGTVTYTVSAIADEGYSFENEQGTEITWTFEESTEPCDMPAISWKLPTCLDGTQSVTVIYDTEKYLYTISKDGGEEVTLASGTTTLATGAYTIRAYELWYTDPDLGPVYWTEPSQEESRTILAANGCGGLLPTPAELPHTGGSMDGVLVALVAAIATYGAVYFAQPRRQN
ncbi:MAG TPA: hypothetical protein PKV96_01590 [Candidatus Saccharimonas sp.]|jgi:hypothetical protein|nr:hypothetical protein [Candidatus Saccharimonas sp.]